MPSHRLHQQRRQREPHGSPDYGARVNVIGDPGGGCSSDPLRQFNTAAFSGPLPGSLGLESGNGYLRGCFISQLDLAIARTIRLGVGSSSVQLRLDVFNLFNQAAVTNRNTTMQMASPARRTRSRTCRSMRTAT